jgi:hypothetical protein
LNGYIGNHNSHNILGEADLPDHIPEEPVCNAEQDLIQGIPSLFLEISQRIRPYEAAKGLGYFHFCPPRCAVIYAPYHAVETVIGNGNQKVFRLITADSTAGIIHETNVEFP